MNRKERIKNLERELDKDKTYYHCFSCGILFEDKERKTELVSLYGLGRTHATSIPEELFKYHITTGLCGVCRYG